MTPVEEAFLVARAAAINAAHQRTKAMVDLIKGCTDVLEIGMQGPYQISKNDGDKA